MLLLLESGAVHRQGVCGSPSIVWRAQSRCAPPRGLPAANGPWPGKTSLRFRRLLGKSLLLRHGFRLCFLRFFLLARRFECALIDGLISLQPGCGNYLLDRKILVAFDGQMLDWPGRTFSVLSRGRSGVGGLLRCEAPRPSKPRKSCRPRDLRCLFGRLSAPRHEG